MGCTGDARLLEREFKRTDTFIDIGITKWVIWKLSAKLYRVFGHSQNFCYLYNGIN